MINKKLQDELSLTILRISLKGKYGIAVVAEANDLTLQQAMTLCLLEPDVGVPMRAVVDYLTCDACRHVWNMPKQSDEAVSHSNDAEWG